jgi:manganese efflux pump family protein
MRGDARTVGTMSVGAILLLAVGLAMDATAVAAARGLAAPRVQARQVVLVATLFGGFQALMPLLGWLIGSRLGPTVERFDHWIAFALLGAIGSKMLYEAFTSRREAAPSDGDLFRVELLLVLALATSIDALAAGVTLPMLDAPLVLSLVTIGVTTAVLSALGLVLGRRFGAALGKRLDIAGGLVLIGLGTKILVQHLHAR